jgi:pilus assembly protein Flp/PilA
MDSSAGFLEARGGSSKCAGKHSVNLHDEGEYKMTGLFMQAYLTVQGLHRSMLDRARSERGASMVEYALLVGLIAIVAVVAVTFLGSSIKGLFNTAATNINAVNSAAAG